MNTTLAVQQALSELEQVEAPVQHFFTDGIYARSCALPAGTLAVGKCHRNSTLNVLLKGEILIYAGPDLPPMRMEAPCVFESGAGVKKVVYAVTDAEIMNVHASQETDLVALEKELIMPDCEYAALQKAAQEVIEWHG